MTWFMQVRRTIAAIVYPEAFFKPARVTTAVAADPNDTLDNRPARAADLLQLAKSFSAHTGLAEATISNKAVRHARLFQRLRGGFGCTLETAESVLRWFSDNWPADLAWPADIPRPSKSKEAA